MAPMLHVIIFSVTLLFYHTSYGTEIDQEFQPELQNFKDAPSLDLTDIANKDSSKFIRKKDNFENYRKIDDNGKFHGIQFKPENVVNTDLKKLLQSLVVVLKDLRNQSGDNSLGDQFEKSSYEKMPSSLNSMQLKTNQSEYRGVVYKGNNNEDKAGIEVSSEGYEKERYSGNVEQGIPPSFDPKVTTGTDFFQNVNRESGEFIDEYINYSTINNPRQRTQKRIENSKNIQTPVLNSEIYRYVNRNPTVKLTDNKPAGLFATNVQHTRPKKYKIINFNKNPYTERYKNLDRNRSVVGIYKFPSISYTNEKNIQPNQQKPQNFWKGTKPEDMSLKKELETGNYRKKNSNKDDNEDDKLSRSLNTNSQNFNSNQPYLSNFPKEPTESYQSENRNRGDSNRFKSTDELNINIQNIPLNYRKQTISNRESITENNENDDRNKENIINDKRSKITDSNSQNSYPNQSEQFNPPEESRPKTDKNEDAINLSKHTDEWNRNTQNIDSNQPTEIDLNRESITGGNPMDSGNSEDINNKPYSISDPNSQNMHPNKPKLSNPYKETSTKNEQNTIKNEDEINISEPTDLQNTQTSEPKQTISNKESKTEDKQKDERKENNSKDEPFSLMNANTQNIYSNQSKQTNQKSKVKNSQSDDKVENDFGHFEPTNDFNTNEQSIQLDEPEQTNINGESKPDIFSKVDNNEDYDDNTKPLLEESWNNKQLNRPKENSLDKESETDSSEDAFYNYDSTSVTDTTLQNTNSNLLKQISTIEESEEENDSTLSENPKNTSEGNVLNSHSDSETSDYEYEEESSDVSYDTENYDEDEKTITNFPGIGDIINANSQQLQNSPNAQYQNNRINSERSPIFENKNQITGVTARDGKFDSAQMVPNIEDSDQEKNSESEESYENDNQDEDEESDTNFQYFEDEDRENSQQSQNSPTPNEKSPIKDEGSPPFENDSDDGTSSFEYEEDSSDERYDREIYDEEEKILTNFPDFGDVIRANSQQLQKNEQTNEPTIPEENLQDIARENTQQSQNFPLPYGNDLNKDEKSSTSENENQTSESLTLEEKLDSDQTAPNLSDSEEIVSNISQQLNNSPIPNENEPVIDESSPTSEIEDQTCETTTSEEKVKSSRNVLNFPDSKKDNNENSQQFRNTLLLHKNSKIQDERSPTFENKSQTDDLTITGKNLDSAQIVPDSPESKDVSSKRYEPLRNSPTPNETNPVNDEKSPFFENESQTEKSTTLGEKHDSPQNEPNFPDTEEISSENAQQLQNSRTQYKISRMNEMSPTFENKSRTDELWKPVKNFKSAETVPDSPDSENVNGKNSQQLKYSPAPNEYNPINEKSPTFENESQTNESKTHREKINFKQTVPNFPDFEDAVIRNSQEFQNLPVQYGNDLKKVDTSPSSKQVSKVNKQIIPGEKIGFQQTLQMQQPIFPDFKDAIRGNSQQFQNLPSYGSNLFKDERTSKKESQANESKTSGGKFGTIVEFLRRFSKNPAIKEMKQNGALSSLTD